ncbi:MAG: hypothetical protein IPK82_16535 [Polyangiaceae bacterium]|nr:hypothetical protein [Polyangiaceae bacterium]
MMSAARETSALPAPPRPVEAVLRAPVAITAMGAVSAVGYGVEALWSALSSGKDGIRPVERFSTEVFSVHTAALVPSTQFTQGKKTAELALEFAIFAARGAADAAELSHRIQTGHVRPDRVAMVFGTSLATHPEGIFRLAELTADVISAHGPRLTISTACSSSANAVGLGRDLLLSGVADVVIAGGADALTEEIFAGFHNLGLLNPQKCAPFSSPPGTTLGEGAGFLVLERAENAQKQGKTIWGWVSGMGLSCDAYHATSPDASGSGVARAARAAVRDAGLTPLDINYVNAHGTGTEANDPAEWRGIVSVFGAASDKLTVSASKSIFGHGQGAAGVLEMIATLLAIQHNSVPQTLHHVGARPRCPVDPVAQSTPRPFQVTHALCNSSAFGGANALVVLDSPHFRSPDRAVVKRDVYICGVGAILPGVGDAKTFSSLPTGAKLSGPIGDQNLPKTLSGIDMRGFDPLSRYLTIAASEALRDSGLNMRGPLRDRTGLFGALVRISPASAHELQDSVNERGLLRLSAPAFTKVVLNASIGACARAFSLRGPTTTVTTGNGSGLTALALACDHLALRDDADVLCVAAADELDRDELPDQMCEAGVCIVLATPEALPKSEKYPVRLAGVGLAGPGQLALAVERAFCGSGFTIEEVAHLPALNSTVIAPSSHPLLNVLSAAVQIQQGKVKAALISNDSGSCSIAVLLSNT